MDGEGDSLLEYSHPPHLKSKASRAEAELGARARGYRSVLLWYVRIPSAQATPQCEAYDCKDAGGRATQGAVAEQLWRGILPLRGLPRVAAAGWPLPASCLPVH